MIHVSSSRPIYGRSSCGGVLRKFSTSSSARFQVQVQDGLPDESAILRGRIKHVGGLKALNPNPQKPLPNPDSLTKYTNGIIVTDGTGRISGGVSVQFFGRKTRIILQNHNGPCPLIAICNVLLLRKELNLNSDVGEVSQDELLSLVANLLLDSNTNVDGKDPGYVQSQQQNIDDAIALLPGLTTGICVNLNFTRIDNFESTRECAIFRLLEIPLYHGWIVDPQDLDTSSVIGLRSYDTLMGVLVDLVTRNPASDLMNSGKDFVDLVAATTASVGVPEDIRKGDHEEKLELLRVLKLTEPEKGANVVNTVDNKASQNSSEPMIQKRENTGAEYDDGNAIKEDIDNENQELVYEGGVVLAEQVDKGRSSADETKTNDGIMPRQGELIKNFLKNTSQLTKYGLSSLREGIKERELCVFYWNYHFNTMFKFEGELYILVTDQGYINQPDLVWEKLNEVNGDMVYMTGSFKEFNADNPPETPSWDEQNVLANTAVYLSSINNAAQVNTGFNSDLQLIISLQQQEFEPQLQPSEQQHNLPQPSTSGDQGIVAGPQENQPPVEVAHLAEFLRGFDVQAWQKGPVFQASDKETPLYPDEEFPVLSDAAGDQYPIQENPPLVEVAHLAEFLRGFDVQALRRGPLFQASDKETPLYPDEEFPVLSDAAGDQYPIQVNRGLIEASLEGTRFCQLSKGHRAKSIQELDLSQCNPSYSKLPDDCLIPQASHISALGAGVLNFRWVSSNPDNSAFIPRPINRYEESLFLHEDFRYELHILLENVRSTSNRAKELLKRIDKTTGPPTPLCLENHFSAKEIELMERLYGDYGLEFKDSLIEKPKVALRIVLKRLEQKLEEWRDYKANSDNVCADRSAKNVQL